MSFYKHNRCVNRYKSVRVKTKTSELGGPAAPLIILSLSFLPLQISPNAYSNCDSHYLEAHPVAICNAVKCQGGSPTINSQHTWALGC